MQVMDRVNMTEIESVWVELVNVRRVTVKVVTRSKKQRPRITIGLSEIPKVLLFVSLLDPLAEQTFKLNAPRKTRSHQDTKLSPDDRKQIPQTETAETDA